MQLGSRTYAVDALLRDGGSIHIRSIRSDDAERLQQHFHSLSPASIYSRFFSPKNVLTPQELAYFTEMDGVDSVGLVATLPTPEGERIVGVGRYFSRSAQGEPHLAEVAFAVSDDHQRRGIASLLLEHLARIAHAAGVTEFTADVLGENSHMLHVFARSGFGVKRSLDSGVFHLRFPTERPHTDA